MLLNDRENLWIPVVGTAFKNAGFDPAFGCALARQESAFNPKAESNNAGDLALGGAFGLCQMTVKTAISLGHRDITPEQLKDPAINAAIAAELCVHNALLIRMLPPFDFERYYKDMAALYNSGHLYAKAPYVTQTNYCPRVLSFWKTYQQDPRVTSI